MAKFYFTSWTVYYHFVALTLLIGTEDKEWIHCLSDPVEYTDPFFGHQN